MDRSDIAYEEDARERKQAPRVRLFQETLRKEPFWMLVACILVNRSTWAMAQPILEEIRKRWPSPQKLAKARAWEVVKTVYPLGLQRSKGVNIRDLAVKWCVSYPKTREDVLALPGCGKYAADSWDIFIRSMYDVRPTDSKLKEYMRGFSEC